MTSGASDDDEETYQEGLVDVPVMLNDVDIHVQLQSEEYIHMFKRFSKTRQSAHQTTLGESSDAQELASHSHVSTSQEGGFQTQAGASALQSANQHFTFLRSPAIDADILRHMGEMQRKQRSHLKRKMQKDGRHPTRPKMFQMMQARTTPDGSVMWSNEQSRKVMTLRSWYGPSEGGSSSNTAYQRLLQEQSQQKSEISQQKSEIERMKKIIEDQEQRIAAQSTDIDVRVEAQVEAQLEARVEARLAALQTQMLQSMDK
ncbi:hypothetical protein Taro_049274 [Colocasia esculenta]|uniref:Uncharacterized protein n=1 Tax=Colocasia esculenta TaxID=4460 RepID=A0A843XAI0_COLES|nr:hypothetical protein [Colocasia esculenta]